MNNTQLWISECTGTGLKTSYKVNKVLFCDTSPFQEVCVVETQDFGRMLLNDGLVMISERDEFIYHDMIAHPALFVKPDTRRVLVVGGGDGGTAREVLRHPQVQQCVMVEIDEMVVKACQQFIPQTACVFDNPRLELKIQDAVQYVAEAEASSFDLVLVDSTDPIGPAKPLFGSEFYHNIHRILSPTGIVVSQAETPNYEAAMQQQLNKILNQHFKLVNFYSFCNLTYPGMWCFSFASKHFDPVKDFQADRVLASKLKFQYYTPALHPASFALPNYVQQQLAQQA